MMMISNTVTDCHMREARERECRSEKTYDRIWISQLFFNFVGTVIIFNLIIILFRAYFREIHGVGFKVDNYGLNDEEDFPLNGFGDGFSDQQSDYQSTENIQSSGEFSPVVTTIGKSIGPILQNGQIIKAGQALVSKNFCFRATLQNDGNLVVSSVKTNNIMWSSFTSRTCQNCYGQMMNSGNFVLYDQNTVYWSTNTTGFKDKTSLQMMDDGRLNVNFYFEAVNVTFDVFSSSPMTYGCS